MEILAIIDHDEHKLYIEDVSDETLEKYNGEEEAYIKDNYDLENFSWDWVTNVSFLTKDEDDYFVEKDFTDFLFR